MLKQCSLAIAALAFTAASHAASIPRAQDKDKDAARPTPTMTAVPTTSGGTVPNPKLVAAEEGGPQKVTPTTGSVNLWVKGGHGHWCRGIGICFISGGDGGPSGCMGARVKPEGENVFEGVGTIDKKFLTLELPSGPAQRAERLPIDDDLVLDKCTSNSFGYDSITVLKGTYRVTYDAGGRGKVALKYKARALRTETKRQ
ncbi:MAG TPA: hypothetical protein VF659_06800 [Pyrinomonadaceae bacterium]|jgi:hypothetical protein